MEVIKKELGMSKERLARAFNFNLSSINRRINLLEGICPEAVELFKDRQFSVELGRVLRNHLDGTREDTP